jgi:hypothetical protein
MEQIHGKNAEELRKILAPIRNYLIKGSINEQLVSFIKDYLDANIYFFSCPIFERAYDDLKRITINKYLSGGENKRIEKISFLKYPPSDKVKKYGRSNLINQSVLYATLNNPITALSEMKPKVGDIITLSKWKLKDDAMTNVCPIFHVTSKDNVIHNSISLEFKIDYQNALRQEHSKEIAEQIDELQKFIAECFAKDVNYEDRYDYFLSAYFANKILYEFENGFIDAIIYPSVQQSLTFSNIAIKPDVFDKNYYLSEVTEFEIEISPNNSFNGYWMKNPKHAIKFDESNDLIIWE